MAVSGKQNNKQNNRRRFGCLMGAALLAGLAVCLAAGLAVLLARPRPLEPSLHVRIRVPSMGIRLRSGDPQVVVLQISGATPIARSELWVDGQLAADRLPSDSAPTMSGSAARAVALGRRAMQGPGAPGSGVNQIPWLVPAPGAHVLVARVYGLHGGMGQSTPVVVEAVAGRVPESVDLTLQVQEGESLESIAEAWGLTPEQAREANPGLPESLHAGDEVTIPLPPERLPETYAGDDGVSPPVDANPAGLPSDAPGLVGLISSLGCRVTVNWGSSEGALGYRIYRYGGINTDFEPVGETPPGQTSWEDAVPFGGNYQYYLVTMSREGETPGPMASIEVAPDDCSTQASPDSNPLLLQFKASDLVTDGIYDKLYCYASLGEGISRYRRVPQNDDAFLASPDGHAWDTAASAEGLRRLVFPQPLDRPVSLAMECWGWRGNELHSLGSFSDRLPRESWGQDLTGIGQDFRLQYLLEPYTNDEPLTQLLIEDDSIPAPYLVHQPEDQAQCLAHANKEFVSLDAQREAWAGAWACLVVDPEGMIIWEWQETAEVRRWDLAGYRIFFNPNWSEDSQSAPEEDWLELGEVSAATQAFPIVPIPCGETYAYRAIAFISGGMADPPSASGEQGPGFIPPNPGPEDRQIPFAPRESPPSAPHPVHGPECPRGEVLVNIVLDSIEVGRTWDEFCLFEENLSCTDEELETYGSGAFYLISEDGSSQELATLEFWQESGCGIFSSGCVGENLVYDHSEIDLGEEDIRLCPSDGACTGPGPGRNWVQTWVGEGDTVEFVFILWDHDDDSGDDIWCGTSDDSHFTFGQAEVGTETKPMIITTFHPENWPPLTERTGSWDNDGLDYQDSRCTVNVSVRSWETR